MLTSLISILDKLDSGKRITATYLASFLGVTERSVYRYITALQEAGYPVFFD